MNNTDQKTRIDITSLPVSDHSDIADEAPEVEWGKSPIEADARYPALTEWRSAVISTEKHPSYQSTREFQITLATVTGDASGQPEIHEFRPQIVTSLCTAHRSNFTARVDREGIQRAFGIPDGPSSIPAKELNAHVNRGAMVKKLQESFRDMFLSGAA